jgi:methionyl-tRNA synthetase
MVGKDILRFHALYWPAILMAADIEPPKRVFAHGWWTNEGQKISKSVGNVIDPFEIIQEFGLDQVRYFLMREVPFGKDGDFSRQAMANRINGDLANDLGNLAQRSISMIYKNCEGHIPQQGALSLKDQDMLALADGLLDDVRSLMEEQKIHRALEAIWKVVARGNGYFAAAEPWALKNNDPARMETVLYVTAEVIRQISILVQFIMPLSASKLLDQLAVHEEARGFDHLGQRGRLKTGVKIHKPEGVFPRYQEQDSKGRAKDDR